MVSIVVIVLLISVAISGYLYVTLVQTQNDLGNQIVELENERDDALAEIENLEGQIMILQNSVATLKSERDEAKQQVDTLQDQLNDLENQFESLNAQIIELNSQITNLNTELNEQNTVISEMLLQLDNKYHLTNDDGIYILNYTIAYGLSGLSQTYTADITLYNALSTATVTIKLYGSDSVSFTYEMATGSTLHRVETWTGDIWARNYANIVVDSVVR